MAHNTIAEMRQILDSMEQGRPIQAQTVNTDCPDEWDNYTSNTPNFFAFRYRIKPEPPKKKWRPFKDVDEFIKAAGGLGAIWVKRKADNRLVLVSSIDNSSGDCVFLTLCWVSFSCLFDCYTFADGTPCGVEEQQ